MNFLLAFLVAGIICAVFQLFAIITKLNPIQILTIGILAGAILTPIGFMPWLESIGGGGVAVLVLDAGSAITNAFLALFAGNPAPIITLIILFIILIIVGVITGTLYLSKNSEK